MIAIKRLLLSFITLTGWVLSQGAQPVDSLVQPRELKEVTVKTIGPRRVLKMQTDGRLEMAADMLAEQPAFMGAPDPVTILRTLPAVATNNDLQASLIVRGASAGANLYETDGVRIVNPLHMLGLFSAFNPAYYRSFTFRSGRMPAAMASLTGGYLAAHSGTVPDTTLTGTISLGLIESHGAIHIPLAKGRSSLSVGARQTYLNLLFPDILKLGKSRIDYNFTDVNARFTTQLTNRDQLTVTAFANRDRMGLESEKNGKKDGDFGWSNIAAGINWTHNRLATSLSLTRYNNGFSMNEGGRALDLPTDLTQLTARAYLPVGNFDLEADVNYRTTSGQQNIADTERAPGLRQHSGEGSVAVDWHQTFNHIFTAEAGLRLTAYGTPGYTAVVPLPRINLTVELAWWLRVFASYGRYMRFDRLVEESSGGLPADYWLCSSKSVKPEDVHSLEAGIGGTIPGTAVHFTIEGYYRRLRHAGEFAGSLLDLTSPAFNPADHIIDGKGYSAGLSVTAMRQVGKVRGRIGYNLGRSRLQFDRYGNDYVPSAHDRLHDLNATLSWTIISPLTVSASFTYATGTPYTQAKFGYMIEENLICEYFPHNSSRLPSYKRLDLSATWKFTRTRLSHSINISVYNALANHNVLFVTQSYSIDKGIQQLESVMKSVIPSISYTLQF